MSKVTILCSDEAHPVNGHLVSWIAAHGSAHDIRLVREVDEVDRGDFLFLISCSQIVAPEVRQRFRHALVVHASDLPAGRGWSPHVWSVLQGADTLVVALLVSDDPVDSGDVFHKEVVPLDGSELYDEINEKLFNAELRLMSWALEHCDDAPPEPQRGAPSYWPRRTPADSRIDTAASIAEVFDLLRVADPDRFPAYFDYRGHRYHIRIEKSAPVAEV